MKFMLWTPSPTNDLLDSDPLHDRLAKIRSMTQQVATEIYFIFFTSSTLLRQQGRRYERYRANPGQDPEVGHPAPIGYGQQIPLKPEIFPWMRGIYFPCGKPSEGNRRTYDLQMNVTRHPSRFRKRHRERLTLLCVLGHMPFACHTRGQSREESGLRRKSY